MGLKIEGLPDPMNRRLAQTPAAFAIEHRLQCLASLGVVSRVWRTTSTTSSSIWRGASGRGSS
jgi:hypothetical protein